MQECFESQDIGLLQQVIKELPEDEARFVFYKPRHHQNVEYAYNDLEII